MICRPLRLIAVAVPVAAVTALVCLGLTGQLRPPAQGLPDAGSAVRTLLPVARTLQDLTIALTIGLLVLAACVVPPTSASAGDVLEGTRLRAVRLAGLTASLWVLAAGATLLLTYADVAGVSPTNRDFPTQLGYFLRSFDLGRALSVSLVLASCVAGGAFLVTRTDAVGWLVTLAVMALLPLALTGHAAAAGDHQAAVDSLALHLVTVCVWVGGLAALVTLSPWLGHGLSVSARRFSTVALCCFVVVAVSGFVNAWVRVGSWVGLNSSYGALLAVKAGALGALAAAGWWHRRAMLARLDGEVPRRRAFLRLAVVEVLVMAATMGVAVALSRSAPPLTAVTTADPAASLLGFPTPPPLTLARWLTTWNLEPAWTAAAVVGLGWYVIAVRRLRRSDRAWPIGRTASWVGGCLVVVWVTGGAPGTYGRTQFSVQVVQHVTLMMVVPMLLVLGSPLTLALATTAARADGSRGPREWLLRVVDSRTTARLATPVASTVLFVATPFLLAVAPVFRTSLSTHAGHLLAGGLLVASGGLFVWVLLDAAPADVRVERRSSLVMLLVALVGQVVLSLWLARGPVLGAGWFASVSRRSPLDLAADQRFGALLVLALSVLLTLAMAAMVVRRRPGPGRDGQGTDATLSLVDGDDLVLLAPRDDRVRRTSPVP